MLALGDTDADGKPNKEIDSSVTIHEDVLENALSYPSNPVRSLAFSILITSPSTTKPYSETALSLLRKHIGAFFADSDVKFRVDVSAAARDMFRRVRGAIFVLKRSIPRVRAKEAKKAQALAGQTDAAASGSVLYRTNLVSLPEQQLVHCLEYHESFLRWYLDFLCSELIPTASYQRHITSLKALMYIFRLEANAGKSWETADDQALFFDVFDDKWSRALFDLLMDPFDDVRDAATNVLRALFSDARYRKMLTSRDGATKTTSRALEELAKTASELARQTSRADHADGVARVNQLLYRFSPDKEHRLQHLRRLADEVDRKVSVAESDLGRAVREAPVHGDFAALCSTWQVVSEFKMEQDELTAANAIQEQLVSLCQRIWAAVRDILCDDSPEGHLPLHLEEMEGLDTKGLISYSFRATHESSNLMKTMILTTRNGGRTDSVTPSAATFRTVGDLTFDQLSNLRHRGAFTTVSSTFTTCCQQSKHLETPAGEANILSIWYDKTLDTIYSQVSTTRRSAGIPSLITGILAANADTPSFDQVMQKLLEVARIQAIVTETDDTKLPQVHAYNSIKDIFRNSLLTSQGNKSEQYLPECVELAASGLKSEVWAIRNCSLILLRSLVDCLFGNHESKTTIEAGWDGKANRIPYHRYPTLPEVLRSLLESGHKMMSQTADASTAAESVFPALDIIRRAGPPDMLRIEIQGHIAQYLSSPVWHVREMAARTMCSCLLHEGWLSSVQGIFAAALKAPKKQNMLHGALLVLKFVVERLAEVNTELILSKSTTTTQTLSSNASLTRTSGDMSTLVETLPSYNIETEYRDCPDIVAAYLEAINLLWTLQRKHSLPQQPAPVTILPGPESALFRSQHILHQLLAASREGDLISNLSAALVTSRIGSNTLLTALEAMPELYPASAQPISFLPALCGLYVDVSLVAGPAEVKAAAVENLNLVTAQLLSTGNASLLPIDKLLQQWHALPSHAMNPELSNAIIRASGAVVASTSSVVNLSSWAAMLADASAADNSFDTRLAAAEALQSYFTAVGSACATPEHLPVLLALYDILNDDDDDVRDVGADAAKCLLGQATVPIEASTRLLAWMADRFASDTHLKQVACDRIIGGGSSPSTAASKMLAEALRFDDSLFVIEEQNLFIDEVREVARWSAVLETLEWTSDDACLTTLSAWVAEGLESLTLQMQQPDGPLGWASSPDAFAVCSYVVGAAVSLTRANQASASVAAAAFKAKEACQQGNISQLLVDALSQV